MEKKEKKADLGQLLNTLINKGWKPFPNEWIDCYYFKFSNRWHDFMCCSRDDDDEYTHNYTYSWRDIVSKESWLWQFVCENGMVKKDRFTWMISPDPLWEDQYNYIDYRYRLIESSLNDESELEEFLFQNIKVEWKND